MADKRKARKRKEEYGADTDDVEKASKEEYAVAKWLRSNVPTKKTKFLNHHVEYFTGAKAIDALLTSKWATGKNPLFATRLDVADFLHEMLVHKFFHRAKKVPVSEQELKGRTKKKEGDKSKSGDEGREPKDNKDGDKSQTSACEGKDSKESKEKEKRKRKIRLDMHMEQVFLDTPDAYVWIYDPIPVHYWLAGLGLVLAAIGVCMFPLWPPTVRKGVYYLSVAGAAFLVFIIVLAVLRLVVFCAVWVLTLSRHHLWLLPNLVEDVSFLASFWPLYHYEYRGPTASAASKSKKKRKKEKNSDDEERPLARPGDRGRDGDNDPAEKGASDQTEQSASPERQSESDSENSRRSSSERDFEMVEPGDVDS